MLKMRKKRLATLALAALAAGTAVLGTTTTASANEPWQVGVWGTNLNCDAAKYEFCIYDGYNYTGKSVGIPWGARDTMLDIAVDIGASMDNHISSVINNTNYAWALTDNAGDSQVGLKVHSFYWLPNLASYGYDNKASGMGIWKEAGPGA
ncbi:hypothetical protein GCM10010129_78670 [Streptomyces fumigatiscleroticus]|nr:hypothetical protein GCM10010129_78670 [Streptomyces fumigatiscleroticus]